MWRFKLDALPVRWNISTRGIDIPSLLCPSCQLGVERLNHTFFECQVAVDIWHLVRVWLSCNMPIFRNWEEINSWIEGSLFSSNVLMRAKVIVVTVLWVMWRYRNGVAFDDIVIHKNYPKEYEKLVKKKLEVEMELERATEKVSSSKN
ncbi:uncharacterized protein [Rutidosis leptorrhynchoides]|uniref:uncharacterized protein n=1 Tax=Rutidosis leptorrhynchoides TaxID=125765 RepID=UPI003A991DA4